MGTRVLGHVRRPLLRPARAPRGVRPAAGGGGSPARYLALLLATVLGLAAQGIAADADTLDRRAYAARLSDARTALTSARSLPIPLRQPLVERAQALLRQTSAIRLADGSTIVVDDGALAARLTTADAVLDAAVADVTTLAGLASREAAVDVAAADARLRQLVGEQRALGGQVSLIDVVSRWLARSISGLGGAPPDPRIVVVSAGGIGLALLLVILGILGRDLRERFRREVVLPELAAERAAEPAELLRAADAAIRAGRAREAIVALCSYAIATLAAREAIRYDPSLTDREVLVRARAIPHADALRDLIDLHERVSYGLREARAADAERARDLALRAIA